MNEAEIFKQALGMKEGDRVAFVSEACGIDHEIRDRVLRDLHHHAILNSSSSATRNEDLEEPPESGSFADHYRIEEILGRGGMGVVYAAVDTRTNTHVAVKFIHPRLDALDPKLRERFKREVEVLRALDHPCVVSIIDHQLDDKGAPYLVMNLVTGSDLSSWIATTPPLDQRLRVFREILEAVVHVHEAGLVHRDIKPSNVLITEEGHPVLLDFGIASRSDSERITKLTRTGAILGTPLYMAPERLSATTPTDSDAGVKSDVYSLGLILYEILTGARPFVGSTSTELREESSLGLRTPPNKHVSAPKGTGRAHSDLCIKALRADPNERYPTARAFHEDVVRVQDGEDPMSKRSAPHRVRDWARPRRRLRHAAAAIPVLAIAGFAGGQFLPQRIDSTGASDSKVDPYEFSEDHWTHHVAAPTVPSVLCIYSNNDFGMQHKAGLAAALEGGPLEMVSRGAPQDAFVGEDPTALGELLEQVKRDLKGGSVIAVVGPCHTAAAESVLEAVSDVNPRVPVFLETAISRTRLRGDAGDGRFMPGSPVYRISSGVDERAGHLAYFADHLGRDSVDVAFLVDRDEERLTHGEDLEDALMRIKGWSDRTHLFYDDTDWDDACDSADVLFYLALGKPVVKLGAKLADKGGPKLVGVMAGWAFPSTGGLGDSVVDISDFRGDSLINLKGNMDPRSRPPVDRLESELGRNSIGPADRDLVFSFDTGLLLQDAWIACSKQIPDSYGQTLQVLIRHIESQTFVGISGAIKFPPGGGQNLNTSGQFQLHYKSNEGWQKISPEDLVRRDPPTAPPK